MKTYSRKRLEKLKKKHPVPIVRWKLCPAFLAAEAQRTKNAQHNHASGNT